MVARARAGPQWERVPTSLRRRGVRAGNELNPRIAARWIGGALRRRYAIGVETTEAELAEAIVASTRDRALAQRACMRRVRRDRKGSCTRHCVRVRDNRTTMLLRADHATASLTL